MRGRFLVGSKTASSERNIYADRSSLILDWLFRTGLHKEKGFSLREVAQEIAVSLGLVQRVFAILVANGVLRIEGLRTAKRFFFKKPNLLLQSWLEQYSIVKKCKMWTYRTGLRGKEEMLATLKKSPLNRKMVLALHSAAEAHGYKHTNLKTLELYMLDPAIRSQLEDLYPFHLNRNHKQTD